MAAANSFVDLFDDAALEMNVEPSTPVFPDTATSTSVSSIHCELCGGSSLDSSKRNLAHQSPQHAY